jgi:hypothetical protein
VENFLPTVEGPLTRRPGFAFIAPQANEDFTATLIPFVFSATQRYQLEFGQNILRVLRDQSLVLASAHTPTSIQAVTPANPLEALLGTTTGLATGDSVFITGTACPEINNQFFRVTIVSGSNITLNGTNGLTFTAQASPAGTAQKVYAVATPYTAAQAETLRPVQNGDVIYLACPGLPRYKLSRLADDNWTFTLVSGAEINTVDDKLGSWPPFAVANATATALYISADTAPAGSVTVTATGGTPFASSDVGRYLAIAPRTSEMGYGLVTGFTSSTVVTVQVYSRFPNAVAPFTQTVVGAAKATTSWAWGAYDATNGYPKTVALFDGRLVWSGSTTDPTSVQCSIIDNYENHRSYDANATDAAKFAVVQTNGFKFRTRSGTQDGVEWMASLDQLFLGTASGEWTLETTDPLSALGPSNFRIRQRGRTGSRKDVLPLIVDSLVLFVQRAGRRLKEFVFRQETNSYEMPDMTRLSRYATLGRIKRLAYQQEPNRVVWAVLLDGSLVSFTYERGEEVTAWATHPIAGTDASVESVSVTPSFTEDEDEVWITVKRTIGGRTRRYIEVLQHFWDSAEVLETAVFSDSAVLYAGAPTTKLYGLLHLVGETVKILADAAPVTGQAVDADGAITLAVAASNVAAGLPLVSRFRSMRPDFGGSTLTVGTAQGYRKRTRRVAFRLVETGQGLFYGANFTKMDELAIRTPSDPMDAAPPLFSGDTGYAAFPGGFDLDGFICLYFDNPLPCTVAATFAKMQSEENE